MLQVALTNEKGVSHVLGVAPVIIDRAQRSAVLRTAHRFEQALKNRIQTDLDIPVSAFVRGKKPLLWVKDWTRVKVKRVGSTGLLWIGYNPIKAGYVAGATKDSWGRLKQEDWGASARSYLFPGGFLARMESGHRGIFKRQGAKRTMEKGRYQGKLRQPLADQVVRIDRVPEIARALMSQTADWYREDLARQISQRLTKVAGGRLSP